MEYRFPKWKDASWNSFERQGARYEVLRPYLGQDLVGAEIGVYKGGFGEFLLPHCAKLYLVDPWYRAGGFWTTEIADDSRVDTVIAILAAYKAEIEAGRVEVVVDYAENFLRTVPDQTFDFIYIDSSHKYDSTLRELALAHRKLKPDGRLFGDDYDADPKSKQHGVYRAVNEFAKGAGARLFLNAQRQWGLHFPAPQAAAAPARAEEL
jgi:SAM-dependent methyltransferase